MPRSHRHFARLPDIIGRACLGASLLALASAPALAEGPEAEHGREPRFEGLKPIVRIVSPLADFAIVPGASRVGKGSSDGTGFVVTVEVVTRDQIGLEVREATLAPPVFGIRHVPELNQGARNPDVPGLLPCGPGRLRSSEAQRG